MRSGPKNSSSHLQDGSSHENYDAVEVKLPETHTHNDNQREEPRASGHTSMNDFFNEEINSGSSTSQQSQSQQASEDEKRASDPIATDTDLSAFQSTETKNSAADEKKSSNSGTEFKTISQVPAQSPLEQLNRIQSSKSKYSITNLPLPKSCKRFVPDDSYFINYIWPLAFYGLLFHDVVAFYAYPNDRFNTDIGQILLSPYYGKQDLILQGKPAVNLMVWSVNLGSSVPGPMFEMPAYWFPTAFVLLANSCSFFYSFIKWRVYHSPNITQDKLDSKIYEFKQEVSRSTFPYHSFIKFIFPCTNINKIINYFEFLKRNHGFSRDHKKTIGSQLDILGDSSNRSPISQYYARKYRVRLLYSPETTCGTTGLVLHFLAKYYALTRLIETFVMKIIALKKFYDNKSMCENNGENYVYVDHLAWYACAMCPDWEDVYPEDIFNAQSCIDGYLSRERTSEEIIYGLQRVKFNITRLNFTKQRWQEWRLEDWTNLFNNMTSIQFLDELNLSAMTATTIMYIENKLKVLAQFLGSVPVNDLNMANLALGAGAINFFPRLRNAKFSNFNLANTFLGTEELIVLSDIFQTLNLTSLILSSATPNFTAVQYLMKKLTRSIQSLDVSFNSFDSRHFSAISNNINSTGLTDLNLSGNRILNDCVPYVHDILVNSSLTSLNLSNTKMMDVIITRLKQALERSSLKIFDLSHNLLTGKSLEVLSSMYAKLNLQYLNLSFNQFVEDSYDVFFEALKHSTVKTILLLAGSFFNESDLIKLALALRSVKDLDISSCYLGERIAVFFNQLRSVTHHLEKLNIADNQIPASSGLALLPVLQNSSINILDVSNNFLDDEFGVSLANIAPGSNISTIIGHGNKFAAATALAFSEILFKSKMTNFMLDIQSGMEHIIRKLVTTTTHFSAMGNPAISYDEQNEFLSARANTSLSTTSIVERLDNATKNQLYSLLPTTYVSCKELILIDQVTSPGCRPNINSITERSEGGYFSSLHLKIFLVLGGAFVLFLLYRAMAPCISSRVTNCFGLFANKLSSSKSLKPYTNKKDTELSLVASYENDQLTSSKFEENDNDQVVSLHTNSNETSALLSVSASSYGANNDHRTVAERADRKENTTANNSMC